MKRNLRFIYIAYGLSIAIIVAISAIFYNSLNSMITMTDRMENTYKVINQLSKVQLLLLEAENEQRAMIINDNIYVMDSLTASHKRLFAQIDTLKGMVVANQQQQNHIIELRELAINRFDALMKTLSLSRANDIEQFEKTSAIGREVMEKFSQVSAAIKAEELRKLEETRLYKQTHEENSPVYLNLIFLISCFFQILSFFFIIREFRKRYKNQKELEDKISELNASNAELEQIAFVASHDLQEPLRKIRTFSDRIVNKYADKLDDEGKVLLDKISYASLHMRGLIDDLINYTSITQTEEEAEEIPLNKTIEDVTVELMNFINEKDALIDVAELPTIKGFEKQIHLLFSHLVENALKFSKEKETPIIRISSSIVRGTEVKELRKNQIATTFIKITVSDNGVGINEEFADKMFIIFQRLHVQNSEYNGKGIGLAICKRIMNNHHGYITASGEVGVGTTINLYFPNT